MRTGRWHKPRPVNPPGDARPHGQRQHSEDLCPQHEAAAENRSRHLRNNAGAARAGQKEQCHRQGKANRGRGQRHAGQRRIDAKPRRAVEQRAHIGDRQRQQPQRAQRTDHDRHCLGGNDARWRHGRTQQQIEIGPVIERARGAEQALGDHPHEDAADDGGQRRGRRAGAMAVTRQPADGGPGEQMQERAAGQQDEHGLACAGAAQQRRQPAPGEAHVMAQQPDERSWCTVHDASASRAVSDRNTSSSVVLLPPAMARSSGSVPSATSRP